MVSKRRWNGAEWSKILFYSAEFRDIANEYK